MKAVSHTGLIRSFSRFVRDVRAVSAVEFALILPIMVTLFLSGTELSQAISVKRKAVLVNRTIADLVAQDQNSALTEAEMISIFNASASVVAPFAAGKLKIKVSGVNVDAGGIAKVVWSRAYQDTARLPNDVITLPLGLNTPGSWLLFAETTYEYTPPIGYAIVGMLPLKDTMYMRPRLQASISCCT